jgi:Ca-activated chloride channel family protein
VIDRSGSMGGGRLEMVKNTILDTLARLNRDDYLSVVTFDDDAIVDVPLTKIANLDLRAVRNTIAALQTGGSTNLERGYRFGLAQAANSPEGVEATLMLLSDGHANAGVVDPEALGQLAAAATEHFVTTTTLGIGSGYDERILDAMADSGTGNHIAALELPEAVAGLQAEIDDLLMKTMTDVRVRIELAQTFMGEPNNIRKVRHLRKFRFSGDVAEVELGDLSSGEEKNVVFDLTLKPLAGVGPSKQHGFFVGWEYTNAITGEKVHGREHIEVELVDPQDWVEPVRDEDIVAELKSIRLQDVRDRALALYQAGREQEADELLRAAGEELQQFMDSSLYMSDRNRARMFSQSTEFANFATMSDMNEKQKRIRESRSRVNRDKGDFRDKP